MDKTLSGITNTDNSLLMFISFMVSLRDSNFVIGPYNMAFLIIILPILYILIKHSQIKNQFLLYVLEVLSG